MSISREFVQALASNFVVVPDTALPRVNVFVRSAASSALQLAKERPVEPASIVSQHELIDLVEKAGLSMDLQAIELYVLGMMSGKVNRLHLPDHFVALRRGITTRVHDLIEARPELLHPSLRFAKQAHEGQTPLLRVLVLNGIALDPSRLQAMAQRGDYASSMLDLALQHGKDIGAPLFEAALSRTEGCASTALAILKADRIAQELDDHLFQQAWIALAGAATGRQFQFDSHIEMLRELRAQQDAAGGDGHRLAWRGTCSGDLANNPPEFATDSHPVMGLISYTTLISAVDDGNRSSDVLDFPARPMALGAQTLNALLEPDCRLELGRLSGMDLLLISALWPAASEHGTVNDFWRSWRATSPDHSPRAVVLWAIDTAAVQGAPITIDFFDSRHELKDLLADQYAPIRAHVVSTAMSHTISASLPSPGNAVGTGPTRRMKGV